MHGPDPEPDEADAPEPTAGGDEEPAQSGEGIPEDDQGPVTRMVAGARWGEAYGFGLGGYSPFPT